MYNIKSKGKQSKSESYLPYLTKLTHALNHMKYTNMKGLQSMNIGDEVITNPF